MSGPLISSRPVETDSDANPFTDLHCPECGQAFPGTIGTPSEVMLTLCCEVAACMGADDGDCGCWVECYTCSRRALVSEAPRGSDGLYRCGGCAPVAVPPEVLAAGRAALAAELAKLGPVGAAAGA